MTFQTVAAIKKPFCLIKRVALLLTRPVQIAALGTGPNVEIYSTIFFLGKSEAAEQVALG